MAFETASFIVSISGCEIKCAVNALLRSDPLPFHNGTKSGSSNANSFIFFVSPKNEERQRLRLETAWIFPRKAAESTHGDSDA
jgi:hypothetical protein